jgi:DNA-binding HxlR family transcriptional regulator
MAWNVFDPQCPTRTLLDRIGDKWTVLVVSALHEGPLHFGALKRAVGGVAPKVLTSVLRSLERDGILTRRVYTASPLRVEYALTPLGQSLYSAVDQLRAWAEGNMTRINRARAQHAAIRQDQPPARRPGTRMRQVTLTRRP